MSPGRGDAGVAFTDPSDGDMRGDPLARERVSRRLGIPPQWATVDQVHGGGVVLVEAPGPAGTGDGLVTTVPSLPLAVFTADCLGVVMIAPGTVGVAHAGWRGLAAGIVEATADLMAEAGSPPVAAHVGPGIGPCCFEVGNEVAVLFPEEVTATTWGTTSVDLGAVVEKRLTGVDVFVDGRCTACGGGFSHRRDATESRMAALGWIE